MIEPADRAKAARLLFQLPRGCRTFVALEPANQWGWSEVFDNKIAHLLELILWQNGTPNKKGDRARHKANKPKPFIPDFMKAQMQNSKINEGVTVQTVDDVKSILDLPRGV